MIVLTGFPLDTLLHRLSYLRFSLINICSFRSNITNLLDFLKTHPFSIICLTETWISLDDNDKLSLCSIANYNLFLHQRTSGRGGSDGILVHMDLQSPYISPIALSYGECISCNFRLTFNSHRLIVIYRPPNVFS